MSLGDYCECILGMAGNYRAGDRVANFFVMWVKFCSVGVLFCSKEQALLVDVGRLHVGNNCCFFLVLLCLYPTVLLGAGAQRSRRACWSS